MPAQADDPECIVAEISTNWPKAWPAHADMIGAKFELVIAHNLERGYRLHSFQLHQVVVQSGQMVETIIAVFQKVPT